jgi:hypothetical protein
MIKATLELSGTLKDVPGKPRFTALMSEFTIPIVMMGMAIEFPIKGGIVYPELDKHGTCLCKDFSACVNPNKGHPGRCTEEDLDNALISGQGPGGTFIVVVNHVKCYPGKETVELGFYGIEVAGKDSHTIMQRAGFIVSIEHRKGKAPKEV